MCPRERSNDTQAHLCTMYYSSMVRQGRATGRQKGSWQSSKKAVNIAEVKKYPSRKDGELFGFSVIVVAMLPCLLMPSM